MLLTNAHIYPGQGWAAKLEMDSRFESDRSVVRHKHCGPLRIQRPFYPEHDGTAHVYFLHPPGGIARNDTLEFNLTLHPESRTLVTTPGAGKFYLSPDDTSQVEQKVSVAENAVFEWMPQENIFFNGAQTRINTQLNLSRGARVFAWEFMCFGRPYANEIFTQGSIHSVFDIYREQKLIYSDRTRIRPETNILHNKAGYDGFTTSCTAFIASPEQSTLADIYKLFEQNDNDLRIGVTTVDALTIVRGLSNSTERLKQKFIEIWGCFREQALQKQTIRPRIWNT
jgi:urease accessory protein